MPPHSRRRTDELDMLGDLARRVRQLEIRPQPKPGIVGWSTNPVDLCDSPAWTAYNPAGASDPTVSYPGGSPCPIDIDSSVLSGYHQDAIVTFDAVGELTGDFRCFAKNTNSTAPTGWYVAIQSMAHANLYTARIGSFESFGGVGAPHARIDNPSGNTDLGSSAAARGWYEVSRFGNTLAFAAYGTTDPRTGGVIPAFSVTRTLVGTEVSDFGLGQPVKPGLMVESSASVGSVRFQEFTVMTFA